MLNSITIILLSFSVIFIIIVSLDFEITNSSKFSYGQSSNFSVNNNNISNNHNNSNNNGINSSKIDTASSTTENWLTFSNDKLELKYPPGKWNVEQKLSKFHVLDFKLIKNDPFSFIGISFASLADSDKFTNEIILDEAENFGMHASSSGYKVYEVLEKKLNKYTIDANPSSSHSVKYKYKENDLEGKLLEIFSIIDKKLFTLIYQSTIENFDKELPVVEKIIKSINIIN
jgi:mevalonate kinase